jgi:hypothetical protein
MKSESFQSILENLMSENSDSSAETTTQTRPHLQSRNTNNVELGDWVRGVKPTSKITSVFRHIYGVRAKTAPDKIKIDWTDSTVGAKMLFNYYGRIPINGASDRRSIKRAYHALLFRFHPDHGGTTQEFHELQRAFETLIAKATK